MGILSDLIGLAVDSRALNVGGGGRTPRERCNQGRFVGTLFSMRTAVGRVEETGALEAFIFEPL